MRRQSLRTPRHATGFRPRRIRFVEILISVEPKALFKVQITEHTREADRYDTLGRAGAAERLRRQARTLAAYPT
jgi:hypothetical protein